MFPINRTFSLHKKVARSAFLAVIAFGFTNSCAPGPHMVPPVVTQILPRATIEIGSPQADDGLVEHAAATIPYTLNLLPGVGGSTPTVDLVVCQRDRPGAPKCDIYDGVKATWSSGLRTISVVAPAAAKDAEFDLVACTKHLNQLLVAECGQIVAEAQVVARVAAQYTVALESFTIMDTRASRKDTVHLALAAFASGHNQALVSSCLGTNISPSASQPIFCKGPYKYADLADGTYHPLNLDVGQYKLVPGVGGSLTLAYVIFNFGDVNVSETKMTMQGNIQSHMRSQVMSNNQIPAADFVSDLNSSPWIPCDGPTAAGAVRIFNGSGADSLDELTRATGSTSGSSLFSFRSFCGVSKYQANWRVNRVSFRP